MKYDFETYVERRHTASMKWDTYAEDVLPMWVADTDFRSPPAIKEAIINQANRGLFGYPIDDGSFEEACAHWQETRFGWQIKKEQISWCPSLGTAIALCIRAFTRPGEGVAMLWPIYPPFMRLCHANGREPRGTTLKWRGERYEIDFAELDTVLAKEDTRLLLLCNPHNPTGRVFSRHELERIGDICLAHNVTVFSDEIHGDIVYEGRHIPFPTVSPEMAATSLVGVNPSKTFNVADLRSAAIISQNQDLLKKFLAEQTAIKLGQCSLGVTGATCAWSQCADYADQLVAYLKENAKHALGRIKKEWPGIASYMPEATFLLWLDCRDLHMEDAALERFFVEKAKVGFNPGKDFGPGGEGFMRMNFACPRSLLDEGLDRVARALAGLNRN